MIREFAFRAYESARAVDPRVIVRNWPYLFGVPPPGGIALPPAALRVKVAGNADIPSFLDGGEKAYSAIAEVLARHSVAAASVLDFGCGCGRVLRHWPQGPRLQGCDYNPSLVAWCSRNLPAARFATNGLAPPLAYGDASFNVVYALSVFTHLTEALADAWFAELARVLSPGGVLLFSTHGECYLPRLSPGEQMRFRNGELVVREQRARGSNFCNAFHPVAYVRSRLDGWRLIEFIPEGARGNPRQDLWAFQKP